MDNKALLFAVALLFFAVFKRTDPFSDGPIPARAHLPSEHWEIIKNWDTFVRDLAAFSNGVGSRRPGISTIIFGAKGGPKKFEGDWARYDGDMGGVDGHQPETIDIKNTDSAGVTRCTSTRFAITAYYCGLGTAANLDHDKFKTSNATQVQGAELLELFISSTYLREPFVYRLGIGNKEHNGQSHVWSIVANPDGTYHWLQSFIGHYSLHEWMKLSESRGEHNLTLEALRKKLKKLHSLTTIDAWTIEANAIYLDLFNVDILKKAGGDRYVWNRDDHLLNLVWDPACAFPFPIEVEHDSTETGL